MLNVAAASHNSISRRSGKAVDPEELLRQRAEEQDWSHKLSADLPIVRDVNIFKKGVGGAYVLRRIVTTDSVIYICQVDSDEIIDEIQIHQIQSVSQIRPIHQLGNKTTHEKSSANLLEKRLELKAARITQRLMLLKGSDNDDGKEEAGDKLNLPCLKKIDAVFDDIDRDKNGTLDVQEFVRAFKLVKEKVFVEAGSHEDEMSVEHLQALFRKYDADNSGSLDLEEWRHLVFTYLAPDEDAAKETVLLHVSEKNETLRAERKGSQVQAPEDLVEFCIVAKREEVSQSRSYYLRAESSEECNDWIKYINEVTREAVKRERNKNLYLTIKHLIADFYHHDNSQMVVALLIALSFLGNVLEVQLDPAQEDPVMTEQFQRLDLAFTIIFVIELVINLAAHWFWDFWQDTWNLFDFVVVSVSMVSLFSDLGSATAIRSVRLLRAFRVLRLFGRLNEIRKIISAIGQSLFPVANAFVIVLLIMCVYAILGVQLFHSQQKDAFGNFGRGLYTMFAATTMDGWQELVVIPMIPEEDAELYSFNVPNDMKIVVFFISFFLIEVWTMLPVVVAILLEHFTQACNDEEDQAKRTKLRTSGLDKLQHTLDPLMDMLSQYESDADLSQKIEALFEGLIGDPQCSVLSSAAFAANLGRKRFRDGLSIYVSQEDFEALSQGGKLCDKQGCLTKASFELIMRVELQGFIERQVAKQLFLNSHSGSESTSALLLAMKSLIGRTSATDHHHPTQRASTAASNHESSKASNADIGENNLPANSKGDAEGLEKMLKQSHVSQRKLIMRLHQETTQRAQEHEQQTHKMLQQNVALQKRLIQGAALNN